VVERALGRLPPARRAADGGLLRPPPAAVLAHAGPPPARLRPGDGAARGHPRRRNRSPPRRVRRPPRRGSLRRRSCSPLRGVPVLGSGLPALARCGLVVAVDAARRGAARTPGGSPRARVSARVRHAGGTTPRRPPRAHALWRYVRRPLARHAASGAPAPPAARARRLPRRARRAARRPAAPLQCRRDAGLDADCGAGLRVARSASGSGRGGRPAGCLGPTASSAGRPSFWPWRR